MTRVHAGRVTLAFALALVSATPAVVYAQAVTPPTDSVLMKRADSLTVGDYCRLAQQALGAPAVIAALDSDSTDARSNAAVICDPLLSSFSLSALAGRAPAPLAAIARINTDGSAVARKGVFEAMSEFRAMVRGPSVRPVVQTAIGAEASQQLASVAETAQSLLVVAGRDRALVRLAKYERKLGPTSAKLNGPEVLLNYVAQLWVPGFKATPLGGPSPLELVASYAPGYVTSVDGRPQAVSASEFGIRYYLFGERFGQTGYRGLLLPSYRSAGVITASSRNGALVWPWEGRDRSGAYVSWGAIKVGYIKGRQGEWLLSKQFQAVPFVF